MFCWGCLFFVLVPCPSPHDVSSPISSSWAFFLLMETRGGYGGYGLHALGKEQLFRHLMATRTCPPSYNICYKFCNIGYNMGYKFHILDNLMSKLQVS